ncbi:peptide deformylase [Seleniivibrio woodruffii]|uniref:Peptide deformylase n=1 Tax=Seleniivibrio woodruffii TaxID=1078050 RepID=A0A4R1KAV3_9BACT|nr:peptide deformylase [Seleniivibrio woodruffii]TCK61572.1 peptide deformylase [Seleniivibrio woodruffii]TVZ35313.1 peptide deformylase [Seleniivibrio woodruffii]
MIRRIHTFPDDVLRKKALPVEHIDAEISELLNDMTETMYNQKGVGLAAPQVGVGLRVIVIDTSVGENPEELIQLINPEITAAEGEQTGEEGCLSIPGEYEAVRRYSKVSVRALNPAGEVIEFDAEGFLARAVQHEIDHLEGTLFIDRIPPYKRDIVKKHIKRRMADGDYGYTADVKS